MKVRGKASAVHAALSLLAAGLVAALVFAAWYPFPYREVSGGKELFLLIVGVDVIVGPLLTFIAFNPSKSREELGRDLAIIVLLQCVALLYGLWTAFLARPVYLVHEVDRFRVVTAADIDPPDLATAQPQFRTLPTMGVELIGVRESKNSVEMFASIEQAMAGKDKAFRPDWWQSLSDENRDTIRQRARPVAFLKARAQDGGQQLARVISDAGVREEDVVALPMMARRSDWSVLLDRRSLQIVGFIQIDAF